MAKENMPTPVPDVDDSAGDDSTGEGSSNGKVSYEAMFSHPNVKVVFEERIHLPTLLMFLFIFDIQQINLSSYTFANSSWRTLWQVCPQCPSACVGLPSN